MVCRIVHKMQLDILQLKWTHAVRLEFVERGSVGSQKGV
jgi:hypothetical protein